MLVCFNKWKGPHLSNNSTQNWPSISIVVPVYNHRDMLQRCLYALCAQSYPQERYEIIVVDDGSTDDSAAVALSRGQEWAGRLRVVRQENGGPASARNAGIAASHADYIAFTDADCVPETGWLRSLALTIISTQADGVGGPISNDLRHNWIGDYLVAAQFFRHREWHGVVDYLLTANVIFRRQSLQAVQGFSVRKGVWGEDADLSFRLKQAGFTLVLSPQGRVTHYGTPGSLPGFVRELYRYGRGNAILSRQWANGRTPPVELLRHGAAVILAPLLTIPLIKNAGLARALSFYPLIVLEHLSFCWGLLCGMFSREMRHAQ